MSPLPTSSLRRVACTRSYLHSRMVDQLEATILKRQRTTIKASCTRIRTYVESIAAISPSIVAQLEERKAKLEHYWAEYNDVQSHLESLDESEGCDRDGFEEAFYVLSDRIRELISPSPTLRTSIFSPSSSSVRDSDSSTHIRMPKLNYRHFPANMMNGSRLSIHSIRLSIPHLALKYAKISVSTSVTHRRRKRCNQFIRIVGR